MSAADNAKRLDRSDPVEIIVDGETQSVTYRAAVGLISLGRAQWANPDAEAKPKRKRATKASKS